MDNNKKILLSVVLHEGANLLFFDSDSDDDDHNNEPKIYSFAEVIVPSMNSRQFQRHFRMDVNVFEVLLQKLHGMFMNDQQRVVCPGRPEISIEKGCMVVVWYLANMESIRSVANRFGISNSTCWMVLYKICNMLVQLSLQHRLIAWPSPNSLQVTCNSFQQHFGMRGVIGAIDGSHIRINAPKDHHTSYINRKGYHSVLLQAVCNADMLFTDVYTGYPGSVHDAALFKRSDLCNNISTGAAYVGEFYLLGDKAYPLQTVLMVPFKDTGRLSRQQKHFNVVLSKSRVVIENAFALLKGRFRRLKYIETVKLEYIVLLIMAATILHNLCILCKDEFRQLIDITVEIAEEREMNDVEIHNIAFRNNLAIAKRQEIMNSLAMILNN
ncbi:hypothetical protein PPYR_00437 [Photinus pyralis]|uniref:DDE Tnp4 domain-containing protein n=2 Tax=Photinus pyralis TaxID=7054 RepID=A0A5N4B1J0_PHOPY|nr:hypothetical protein PPYR_00437 [Photinus pyralis]